MIKASLLDELDHASICILLLKGVQVLAKRPSKDYWILRDHRDLLSQLCYVQIRNINAIELDPTPHEFYNPRQRHAYGSFTGTSPADDADFFARTHLKAELSEHNLSIWSISELDLLKLNSTLECIHSFLLTSDALISLLRGSLQIEDFLDAHHHALKFIIVTKQAPQPGHLKTVDGCNHE